MRRVVVGCGALMAAMAGCGGGGSSTGSADGRLKAIAAFYLLLEAAQRVGGASR